MARRSKSNGAVYKALLSCLVLSFICFLAACSRQSSGSDHAAVEANQASFQGELVYQRTCAACHDATDLHLIKDPPRLDGLFRKSTFPSGAPATDAEVRNVILHGRGIMPPFEQALTPDELNNLVQYMHTR